MEPDLTVDPTHLPGFITAPGQTDTLFVIVALFLAFAVLGAGALFLTVHSLPERIAHRSKKLQLEIVAVLCLLALFTHQHLFWVIALVLALIDLPDITTPVQRMAAALERMAGLRPIADPEMAEAEREREEMAEESAAISQAGDLAPTPPAEVAPSAQKKAPAKSAKSAPAKTTAAEPAAKPESKES